jgi:hypothetical protein
MRKRRRNSIRGEKGKPQSLKESNAIDKIVCQAQFVVNEKCNRITQV